MKTFLEILEPRLPASQALQIAAIVAQKQRQGTLHSASEITDEVARLLRLTQETFTPSLHVREITDPRATIEADVLNAPMEELDLDLKTLYDVVNQLTGTSRRLQKILHSDLESLRASICRVADDILGHRIRKANRFARVITQGFADARNESVSGALAQIDAQTRTLKLPVVSQQRYHQRRGINPARVIIRPLSTGLMGVSGRTFAPQNAIDPDPDSFWAEVLLAESPIMTTYTPLDGQETIYAGALVEVGLILGAPEFVTDVKILPFGDYPLDIIDVKYRQGSAWYRYPNFVTKSASLNWLEWHGPRILADEVAFVLHQPNYTRVRYHIPASMVQLAGFWEQLLDEKAPLVLSDQVLTQFQNQRAEADARFTSLHEGLRRYGLELQRLDIPRPDLERRTDSEDTVLGTEIDAAMFTMAERENGRTNGLGQLRAGHDRSSGLIDVERVEYIFGARELQANDVQYLAEGHYASPQYAADATVIRVVANPTEVHPTFTDANGTYRQTSIEYEVELASGRRVPVLPKATTLVQDEVLEIDRTTRQGTTRFPSSATTVQQIRRGGKALVPADFTVTKLSTGHLRVTITKAAFSRHARYSVTYLPSIDQDVVKVTDTFDSVRIATPEVFHLTDESGSLELQTYPYVEYGVVNDTDRFRREHRRSSRYYWIGGATQYFLDGIQYGDLNTALSAAITATATTIALTTVSGVQTASATHPSKLRIENEIIQYTGISGTSLTGVTRGVDSTVATSHLINTIIVGERVYEPLIVTIGNVKAINITDYRSGEHPAFLSTSDAALQYEYLHVGKRLFFNRPLTDKTITVDYRWMTQYIQLHARLRSHTVGRIPYTPVLQRVHLEIESTTL